MTKKSNKFKYLANEKNKKKVFFIILKELSLKQIKRILFGRWDSDFNVSVNKESMNKSSSENVFLRFLFFAFLHFVEAAYRGIFRYWSNIYKVAVFVKIRNSFRLSTIFSKNVSSQMFHWVGNRFRLLAKGLKYWAYSCSQSTN